MGDGWRAWASAWREVRTQADEYRELDDERVLVLVRRSGSGKTSGLQLEQMRSRGAAVFHVSGGRVTRLVVYVDRDHALGELRLEG
jgi:ketosteroid isomerase-like protein